MSDQIQAGDWVECIEHWFHSSPPQGIGDRFEVAGVVDGSLCFAEYPGVSWLPERFKRVDGPHPETGVVTAHEGPVVVVRDGYGNIDTVPQCQSCSAVATHGRWCAYCGHREEREPIGDQSQNSWENIQAGRRLAAIDRSEKPRVTNRAEARELEKLHPWEMQDD
jgi:hypothetical protein